MTKRVASRLAAAAWLLAQQHFIVQWLAAMAWRPTGAFSIRFNQISDLGNTTCAPFTGRTVCSPLHAAMNVSFIVYGLAMSLGALLLLRVWPGRTARIGLILLSLSGLGSVLVGMYPENINVHAHTFGATVHFVLGALGIALLGYSSALPRWLRTSAFVLSGISVLSLALTGLHQNGGLGDGLVERLIAYPVSVWLALAAVQLLRRSGRTNS